VIFYPPPYFIVSPPLSFAALLTDLARVGRKVVSPTLHLLFFFLVFRRPETIGVQTLRSHVGSGLRGMGSYWVLFHPLPLIFPLVSERTRSSFSRAINLAGSPHFGAFPEFSIFFGTSF